LRRFKAPSDKETVIDYRDVCTAAKMSIDKGKDAAFVSARRADQMPHPAMLFYAPCYCWASD